MSGTIIVIVLFIFYSTTLLNSVITSNKLSINSSGFVDNPRIQICSFFSNPFIILSNITKPSVNDHLLPGFK